jgi:protein SCO1
MILPRPLLSLAIGLTLPLAACGQAPAEAPPLAGASVGGAFSLTDQDGRAVRDTDFAGRYRLVYFGFANCPDVCPTDLATIGAALRQFEARDAERAARVQPIFITVDPRRDTPAVLKNYVGNFHPRLVGLTGSEEEIRRVTRAYGASAILGEPDQAGAYNVDHTRYIILYGPEGQPIAIVPHERADALVAELDRWVR